MNRRGANRASALPTTFDALQQRTVTLEQQFVDVRLQLEERGDELAAARAADREMMTRINTTPRRLRSSPAS